jgi:hypothetical protein
LWQDPQVNAEDITRVKGVKEVDRGLDKIASLAAKMVELADDVLDTDPWTREGDDARRLFRITIKQMAMRARLTNDPLLIAVVFDSLEKLRDGCPDLFE